MKVCYECNKKIGLFPWLFGIRQCSDCNLKPLKNIQERLQKEGIAVTEKLKEHHKRMYYNYCLDLANGIKPSRKNHEDFKELTEHLQEDDKRYKGFVFE